MIDYSEALREMHKGNVVKSQIVSEIKEHFGVEQ